MAGTTPKGLPYPSAGDAPNVSTDIQNLATAVDTEFDDYVLAASPTFTANISVPTSIIFEGATADGSETTLTVTDPTADRTITLPDATGTVVLADATQTLSNKTIASPVFTGQATGLELAFSQSIVFEGTTPDAYELTLSAGDPTADRTITLPDDTDTLATQGYARTFALMLGGM
jgi:hypothetical protein